jgi:hypothetical protein
MAKKKSIISALESTVLNFFGDEFISFLLRLDKTTTFVV